MIVEMVSSIVICALCSAYSFAYVYKCAKEKRLKPAFGAGFIGALSVFFAVLLCVIRR